MPRKPKKAAAKAAEDKAAREEQKRKLRDRVLLPVISRLPTGGATRAMLQEPTEVLRAIATDDLARR